MKYTLTKELETGNSLIDRQHKELFNAVNNLLDACSQGKGRGQVESTLRFLTDYVAKHFADEERLQQQSNYPGYPAHKKFHESYKARLAQVAKVINTSGVNISALNDLNQTISVLINHIRIEDKKMAAHVQSSK